MEEDDCIIGGEEDDNVSTVSIPAPKHEEEAEDGDDNVVEEILGVIGTASSYSNYRKTQRKDCYNLVRRMKLLIPLFEEIRDLDAPIPDSSIACLRILKKALLLASRLLRNCNQGSKIYLAFECEAIFARFHLVHDKFSQALENFACDELDISEEVKEQVELMRVQLKRAKKRAETQDVELAMDMLVVFSYGDDRNADSAIFERLGKKLDLHSIEDLKEETIAIRKLMKDPRGLNNGKIEKMVHVLAKFKEIMGMEETTQPVTASVLNRCPSLAIPHEFLCPITLEIMINPVIVASGQTYERESIQKWLDSSHRTCPKSGQALDHLSLAPNYALKNIISQWCEKNNFKLVKHDEKLSSTDSESSSIDHLKENICSLVHSLSSSQLQVQRKAVKKIRMLSKENPENRVLIADSGGIPPLVQLLSYPDSKIQEHSVTALLNLSIDETNKKLITSQKAIPSIIEVLKHGNIGAKENSAAALFSLSMMDENKVSIGLSDGIPPLVDLLQHGTIRGKKDAITALFNLCLNQFNRAKAIEHGIIKPLMSLVKDRKLDMIDEALSIILLVSSHPNGRQEIGQMSFIEVLVGYMGEGSEKNKECATAVLLELGTNDSSFMLAALQYGVYDHLVQIHKTGTNRAQRKANSILQLMTKYEQIP